jgi:hypothetical protein
MRSRFVPFLLVALSCLGGPRAFAVGPTKANLALERSEDLQTALAPLGFDEVRVFTWRGGLLGGSITFQDGQDLQPMDLGAVVLATARKLFRDGEALDPKAISGVIVIAIQKPAGDAAKGRPCRVSMAVRKDVVRDDGKENQRSEMMRTRSEIKGLVPAEGAFGAASVFSAGSGDTKTDFQAKESFTPKEGKEFTLYELKLSATPAGAGRDGEGK